MPEMNNNTALRIIRISFVTLTSSRDYDVRERSHGGQFNENVFSRSNAAEFYGRWQTILLAKRVRLDKVFLTNHSQIVFISNDQNWYTATAKIFLCTNTDKIINKDKNTNYEDIHLD